MCIRDRIISCPECGWFGLMEENTKQCPFCGNDDLKITREMMRPWGFAPRNAEAIPDVQLSEEYTACLLYTSKQRTNGKLVWCIVSVE